MPIGSFAAFRATVVSFVEVDVDFARAGALAGVVVVLTRRASTLAGPAGENAPLTRRA